MAKPIRTLLALGALLLASPGLNAQDTPKVVDKPSLSIKHEPLRILLELDGVFESRRMEAVAVAPKAWIGPGRNWVILQAAKPGDEVRRGQTLIQFDAKSLNDEINSLIRNRTRSELALAKQDSNLAALKESRQEELHQSELGHKRAQEDWDNFIKTGKSLMERQQNLNLSSAEFNLAYREAQLRQLENMYKADDLVEESEELVLKRERFLVEVAKLRVEQVRREHEQYFKFDLPRQEEQLQESLRQAQRTHDQNLFQIPHHIDNLEAQIVAANADLDSLRERLTDFQSDLETMTVKATMDGVLYYGSCQRGNFPAAQVMETRLIPGGQISPGEVLMTIVDSTALFVHTLLSEDQIGSVSTGLNGFAIPTGAENMRLPAGLHRIAPYPLSPGKFDAEATITFPESDTTLWPGRSCKLRFVVDYNPTAILVPAKYLDNAGPNPDRWTVLKRQGDTSAEVVVKTGRRQTDKVEILEGLEVGDEILER